MFVLFCTFVLILFRTDEKKDSDFIGRPHGPDSHRALFQTHHLALGRDRRCTMGHDGLLPLAYHIGQKGTTTCSTNQPGAFFSCGILTTDSLAMAGVFPMHVHRSHDAWTGIPVDRPVSLPDWHCHHLQYIQRPRTNPVIHLEVSIKCQRLKAFSNLFVLLFLLPCLESEYFVKCFIPVSCKTNTSVVKIDVRFHLSQFRTLWLIGIVVDVIEIDIILA